MFVWVCLHFSNSQNAVGNMLVRKFSVAPIEAKIQLFKSYGYPIYGCALWRYSYQNSIMLGPH